eukprot:5249388-Pyramimonas_sp.AAC.1
MELKWPRAIDCPTLVSQKICAPADLPHPRVDPNQISPQAGPEAKPRVTPLATAAVVAVSPQR